MICFFEMTLVDEWLKSDPDCSPWDGYGELLACPELRWIMRFSSRPAFRFPSTVDRQETLIWWWQEPKGGYHQWSTLALVSHRRPIYDGLDLKNHTVIQFGPHLSSCLPYMQMGLRFQTFRQILCSEYSLELLAEFHKFMTSQAFLHLHLLSQSSWEYYYRDISCAGDLLGCWLLSRFVAYFGLCGRT